VITGFGGHLLSEDFVERHVCQRAGGAGARAFQRAVKEWCAAARALGPASGLRAVADVGASPLAHLLELRAMGPFEFSEEYAVVACRAGGESVVLLASHWGAALHRFWRDGVVRATTAGAAWCLLFNGTHVRLLTPGRAYSRRYVELDLEAAADDLRTAATLQLIFSARALGSDSGDRSLRALLVAADHHATDVCRSLRSGVLEASTHVLRALVARAPAGSAHDAFEQSLTIVYRLLFLFFAEARALVPMWHHVYRGSYSVEALREVALEPDGVGLWDAVRAVSRLAHAGCQAGGLNVTAFNGRLFSPARTPLAERRGLDDAAARRAIVAVSTRAAPDGEGRERISYRDLGVEELGAVYETLLDFEPVIERARRGPPNVALRTGSGVRKATGTFYTPRPLVDYLVRDTLAPLIRDSTPEQILERKVLDPSMGSGAFLVSACRYLAAAYEAALVEGGRCHPADIGDGERASIRRLIAERCLFGVDINPTAVQLARLSLWLTTLAADRPLTFLDHHLRVGDSLAGTWLSQLRRAPAAARRHEALPLFPDSIAADAIRLALPVRFRLALEPNDTASQVRAKERALAELTAAGSPLLAWTHVADLWCSSWLASPPIPPSAFADLSDAILTGHCGLPPTTRRLLLERVAAAAEKRRLFHWELEYPEVFFDASGARRSDAGFDAIVGNPPWDMVRADTSGDRAEARLEAAALVRFARDAGVYDARADGHVNKYQLFVDRAMALTRPGGRIGLVLPSGMIADAGSAALRRLLFARCAVERIVGFDNRTGTFPIHRSVRFILLSGTVGTQTKEIACRFGEVDPSALDRATPGDGQPDAAWFQNRVTPALLHRISGDELSIPDLRSRTDLAILERAVNLFPPLSSVGGWEARFGRELNATEDRDCLRTDGTGVPVLEGKSIDPFRARLEGVRWSIGPEDAERLLGGRWRRARLAYRDVASATNRLTLIAAILPPRTASTHTLFCLKGSTPPDAQRLLCALLNSLVVNFFVRMRVTTHVTTTIVERLAVPRLDQVGPFAPLLVRAAETLARKHDAAAFVAMNVVVARLYQLSEGEFAHVLSTFPLIDGSERTAMLEEFVRPMRVRD
jgi:hypothetical protein